MASKMELSLDEIIVADKSTRRGRGRGRGGSGGGRGGRGGGGGFRAGGGRGGGGGGRMSGGGGGIGRRRGAGRASGSFGRSPRGAADGVWTHDKFQEGTGFTRRAMRVSGGGGGGGGGGSGGASPKITVSNLHYGVSDADIIELFGEMGPIRYASVHYDRSGRSLGTADVVFERRADAQMAIQQYNGVPLDGRPMVIKWTNPPPAASPRGGLRQVQGGRVGDNRRGGRGGGVRGGRGGGSRGRGGARGGKAKQVTPTAAELDAELDAYVSANPK